MADATPPAGPADPPGRDDEPGSRAMIVALELLRHAVVDSAAMMAATAARFHSPASHGTAGGTTHPAGVSVASAYDRPQPVIVMGPKPLPVSWTMGGAGGRPELPGREPPEKSAVGKLGSMLAAQFSAVLGPLAIFGQVVGSQASGFQVLGSAVKLLAAVLAPIFLPIVLAVAAALVELSDDIAKNMGPAFKSWTRLIFSTVLPALTLLAKVVGVVVNFFMMFANILMAVLNPLADEFGGLLEAIKRLVGWVMTIPEVARVAKDPVGAAKDTSGTLADSALVNAGGVGELAKAGSEIVSKTVGGFATKAAGIASLFAGGTPASPPAGFAGGTPASPGGSPPAAPAGRKEAIDDVIASFRLSIGPKAQFSQLAQVGQSAQLAGLNADPIEQRMLQQLLRIASDMEGVRAEMRRERGAGDPRFGTS